MFGPISAKTGPTLGVLASAADSASSPDEAEDIARILEQLPPEERAGTADVLVQMTPAQRAAVAEVLAPPDDLGDDDDDPAEPTRRPGPRETDAAETF